MLALACFWNRKKGALGQKDKIECQGPKPTPILPGVWLPRLKANSEIMQLVTLEKAFPESNAGRLWPGLLLLPLGPALKPSQDLLLGPCLSYTAAALQPCLRIACQRLPEEKICVTMSGIGQQQKLQRPIMCTSVITFESYLLFLTDLASASLLTDVTQFKEFV